MKSAKKSLTQFELYEQNDENNQIDEMNNNEDNVFKTFLNTSISNSDDGSSQRNIHEVIIRNPSQLQAWLDDMSKKTCRQKVKHVLRSGKFHLALVILVIIESLFVAGEVSIKVVLFYNSFKSVYIKIKIKKVIIYDLEAYLMKHHTEITKSSNSSLSNELSQKNFTDNTFYYDFSQTNNSLLNVLVHNNTANENHKIQQNTDVKNVNVLMKVLHIAERTCKYGSIFILTIFMVEIIIKIIFDPKSFRKVLEILDGLVITISFSLNIFLLIKNIQVHAISGLITLLRYFLKCK
jgi:hypothetical protein